MIRPVVDLGGWIVAPTAKGLRAGVIALAIMGVACGEGQQESPSGATPRAADSIAGAYNCGQEGEPPQDVLELGEDGTVTITPGGPGAPPPEEGTWSVDGNSGEFQFPGFRDQFTIEGDRLEFAHAGAPESERLICTRAT
jgi:hypothetical protein